MWTCTLTDGGGTATGSGFTPHAAFRSADQEARRLAAAAGLDHPDDEAGLELPPDSRGYVVRYYGCEIGTVRRERPC